MANQIQDSLYRVALEQGQQNIFITAKNREELIDFLAQNYSSREIKHACQLMADGSELLIPILADLAQHRTKEEDQHAHDELTKVHQLCSKPFLTRTGAEQEFLYNYWVNHPKYDHGSTSYILGMSPSEFNAWRNGDLKLSDGSYHEMTPSKYHLSDTALQTARDILLSEHSLNSDQTTDEQYPKDIIKKMEEQLPFMERFSTTMYSRNNTMFLLYGVELLAAITQDELLYKEDFASLMKAAGMEATERNFWKVWQNFAPAPGFTLQDCAEVAIGKTQRELGKGSLDEMIKGAEEKATKPSCAMKEKEKETAR